MGTRDTRDSMHASGKLGEILKGQAVAGSRTLHQEIGSGFCADPAQYDWHYVCQQEVLVPFNCIAQDPNIPENPGQEALPDFQAIRWEKHCVRVVDGRLRRGESNLLQRRRFFMDKESGLILLGEGYDLSGALVKSYVIESIMLSPPAIRGRWHAL